MSAAVADFTPAVPSATKLKKETLGDAWRLELARNPDILAEVVPRHRTDGLRVVGFALETGDVVARALAKLQAKGLDFIVANDPTAAGAGFGDTDHQVRLLGPEGVLWESPSCAKSELAAALLDEIARRARP